MAKAPLPCGLGCRLRRRCRCCRRGLWWLHYRWTHLQTNTSCCWQTRAMHCITANVLQIEVDAQCYPTNDNACDGRCFRVIVSYLSKVTNFNLPHLHSAPPLGGDPVWVLLRSLAPETYSLWAIVWRCLHDPMFSRFSRTPTCDRQDTRLQHVPC